MHENCLAFATYARNNPFAYIDPDGRRPSRVDKPLEGIGDGAYVCGRSRVAIFGKAAHLPLYALLGGRFNSHVSLQNSVSTGTPQEMVAGVQAGRAKGYKIHTAKIGADVGFDIERIHALLDDLPPDESVTFDVNRAWLPDQAVTVMNAIHDARPYFEQPCETLEECRTVRQLTRQPMILDECILSFFQ